MRNLKKRKHCRSHFQRCCLRTLPLFVERKAPIHRNVDILIYIYKILFCLTMEPWTEDLAPSLAWSSYTMKHKSSNSLCANGTFYSIAKFISKGRRLSATFCHWLLVLEQKLHSLEPSWVRTNGFSCICYPNPILTHIYKRQSISAFDFRMKANQEEWLPPGPPSGSFLCVLCTPIYAFVCRPVSCCTDQFALRGRHMEL